LYQIYLFLSLQLSNVQKPAFKNKSKEKLIPVLPAPWGIAINLMIWFSLIYGPLPLVPPLPV
jgi:hypothetical protein